MSPFLLWGKEFRSWPCRYFYENIEQFMWWRTWSEHWREGPAPCRKIPKTWPWDLRLLVPFCSQRGYDLMEKTKFFHGNFWCEICVHFRLPFPCDFSYLKVGPGHRGYGYGPVIKSVGLKCSLANSHPDRSTRNRNSPPLFSSSRNWLAHPTTSPNTVHFMQKESIDCKSVWIITKL